MPLASKQAIGGSRIHAWNQARFSGARSRGIDSGSIIKGVKRESTVPEEFVTSANDTIHEKASGPRGGAWPGYNRHAKVQRGEPMEHAA